MVIVASFARQSQRSGGARHEANSTDRARNRSVDRKRSYACHGSAAVEPQLQLLCLAYLRATLQFGAPLFSGQLSRRSSLPILGHLLLLGRPLGVLAVLGLALTGVGLRTQQFGQLGDETFRYVRVMSALPPKADISSMLWNVR